MKTKQLLPALMVMVSVTAHLYAAYSHQADVFSATGGEGSAGSYENFGLLGESVVHDTHANGAFALQGGFIYSDTAVETLLPTQMVSGPLSVPVAPGASFSVPVTYTTSDENNQTEGLGLRIHFDSSKLQWDQFENVLPNGFLQKDNQPQSDEATDYDNDPATDQFLLIGWLDFMGNWPNVALPVELFNIHFTAQSVQEDTAIRFSSSAQANGYAFSANSVLVTMDDDTPGPAWWVEYNVLDAGAEANDYAVANIGQLKYMAQRATEAMEAYLPGGAGTEIIALINGFTSTDDYAAVNVGQLKYIAQFFYDRLGLPDPWTEGTNDYSVVNIGQLKTIFSFEL